VNSRDLDPTPEQRRHMAYIYGGQSVGLILQQLMVASAFGVLFIKHIGGSDFHAMLLGAFSTLPRLLQIPFALLVRPSRGKQVMLWCWVLFAVLLTLAVAASGLVEDAERRVRVVLLLIFGGATASLVGNTFWFHLLHDLVPDYYRGRFFGNLRALWNGTSFLAIVVSGLFLGDDPPLWKFQVILAVAIVLLLVRNLFVARVPTRAAASLDEGFGDWRRYIATLFRSPDLLRFCLYFSLLAFFAALLGGPLVLYLQHRGLATGESVLIFAASTLGQALLLLVGGHLVDTWDTRRVLAFAHLALFAVAVLVVVAGWLPNAVFRWTMPVLLLASGSMLAVASLACTAQLFHLAPDHGRAFFMSLAMITMTTGAALSPVLAGYIIDRCVTGGQVAGGRPLDLFQVITLVGAGGLLLTMALLRYVKDVRGKTLA
jgi:MFS family permease